MKFTLILISLLAFGCSSSTSNAVKRVSSDTEKDLSGYWNDTDSKLVSDEMVKQLMDAYWVSDYSSKNGRKPIVLIGNVRNKTSEHINTSTFTKDLEKELINSGRITFLAGNDTRSKVRDEKMDQQSNANFESAKELGNEKAADFMLLGEISSIVDQVGGEKVVFYQINLELINVETNEKVWVGDKKIKKFVSRDKYKF